MMPAYESTTLVGAAATRAALLEAGRTIFAEVGFSGARLEDISSEANVTTGAFYGHFDTKLDFFAEIFRDFSTEMSEKLDQCKSLNEALETYLSVSRQNRGVVRASSELLLREPLHVEERKQFRLRSADALAWQLHRTLTQSEARLASRFLVDLLDQVLISEAEGRLEEQSSAEVAKVLIALIEGKVISAW